MKQSICVLGLFAALCAFGCSDSDGDGGGGTGGTSSGTGGKSSTTGGSSSGTGTCKAGMDTSATSTSAANACCLLCIKESACKSLALDECAGPGGYRDCDQYDAAPSACAAGVKALYDCLRKQANVCAEAPECDASADAATKACAG